jgi:hypothetical protein
MTKPRGVKSGCLGAGNFRAIRTELQKEGCHHLVGKLQFPVLPVEEKRSFRAHEVR